MTRKVRVILQARTSSSRLPAKVLMPIAGLPLAELCARRLMNTGLALVVATSAEPSDDSLADSLMDSGIDVFRGSLSNVRSRYLECSATMNPDDIVVRVTADNPVPDGQFLQAMIAEFIQRKAMYMATHEGDGLPYGLSAEVFTVQALREASEVSRKPADLEHVTPQIRAVSQGWEISAELFSAPLSKSTRVTVDTLDDYLSARATFARVADPVNAGWLEVLNSWNVPAQIANSSNHLRDFTLGTVQLGLKYGVVNAAGKPVDAVARKLLFSAAHANVGYIDTAAAYGDSENRIGAMLPQSSVARIVTKVAPIGNDDRRNDEAFVRLVVDSSVYQSMCRLRRSELDVVMLHRAEDLLKTNGIAWNRLKVHQAEGRVSELGVSVYSPEELLEALDSFPIDHIQIPFNLLDKRWLADDVQAKLSRPDLPKIHVRSVYLQGLIASSDAHWPEWVTNQMEIRSAIGRCVAELDRESAVDLAIAYVRSFDWVTSLVIGVENSEQLREAVRMFERTPLTREQRDLVHAQIPAVSEQLLNPALWPVT